MESFLKEQNGYYIANRRNRRIFLLFFLVLLALFCLYVSLRGSAGLMSPVQTVKNLFLAARLQLAEWLKWGIYDQRLELILAQDGYQETLGRLQGGALMLALGAMLGVAGAVFQLVFRNPIASPTILGVSSGIRIANVVLVMQYSTAAAYMTTQRYLYGYIGALAMLALVFLVGLLAGRGRADVTDMLLSGSIITRIVSKIVNQLQYYYIEDETDLQALREMELYGSGTSTFSGAIFMVAALAVGFIPIFLLRNSLNLTAFSREEARSMGISIGWMQLLALLCSTVLIIAAQIYAGDVALLAMLVPFVCRYIFGSNTRELLLGSAMMGAGILLICRTVTVVTGYINTLFGLISLNTLVSVVAMPLMLFAMIKYRRGWD